MNRYMWDGSYTVEAAFIVPMVLGIMYAWMFQLFYLHDQMVMDGMLQEMILQPLAEDTEMPLDRSGGSVGYQTECIGDQRQAVGIGSMAHTGNADVFRKSFSE